MRARLNLIGKWVVAVCCIYELAALPARSPLPTISSLSNKGFRHPYLRFIAWVLGGFMAAHMIGV